MFSLFSFFRHFSILHVLPYSSFHLIFFLLLFIYLSDKTYMRFETPSDRW